MGIKFLPYIEVDGCWTLKDSDIMNIYERMEVQGLAEVVFSEHQANERWFLDIMKHGENQLHVIFDGPTVAGIAWLNRFEAKFARVHFCFFGGFGGGWAIKTAKEWLHKILHIEISEGEYLYDCLMGFTPARNINAINFLRNCGVVGATKIPNGTFNIKTGKSEPAMVGYITRDEL